MPQFRMGLENHGYFEGKAPQNNTTLWSTRFDDAILSSPVVFEGRVYVGTMGGDLVCLSAVTGNVIWNFSTGGPIESSPAYHDGYVYVGSDDGRIYKIKADSGFRENDGALIWWNQTGAPIKSSPTVVGDRVLVGSSDFGMHCYDIETSEELWNFSTGGYVYSAAAVADGIAVFGSCDGNVYAVNLTTGSEIWRFQAEYCPASPLIRSNEVFIGTYDEKFYGINLDTGEETMNVSGMVSGVYSSAAVMHGELVRGPPFYPEQMMFVGDNNGTMYGIGIEGDVFWERSHAYSITSSPILIQQEANPKDAYLIYAVQDGTLHMRDIKNPYVGRIQNILPPVEWSIKLGTSIQSSPFIYHGRVYIGVETETGGKVVCIGELWPEHEVIVTADSPILYGGKFEGTAIFTGSLEGVEPDRLRVQLWGEWGPAGTITNLQEPGRWSMAFRYPMTEGPQYLKVWAWKDERLLADEVFHVMVLVEGWSHIDIDIENPSHGERVEGVLLATGTAFSNFTLETVQLRIDDDGQWYTAEGLSNWTAALDTHDISDGEHTLWVRVTDEHRYDDVSVVFRIGEDKTTGSSDIGGLEVALLLILIVILVVMFRTKPARPEKPSDP
ncbi:MAG: PQQ-binding-like beta-propeller repeat protein [Thermoplasmata archaeon]|nr:MAG: PQQ-binding-like beta-propeller repeat protein [Thermoplasmata archaeon]